MTEEGFLEDFTVDFPTTEESYEKGGEKKSWDPLPEGLYKVQVGDVRFKQHARGPMFGLRFNVIDEGEHQNRVVWGNIIFLPYYADAEKKKITPGAGIARSFLKAIGQEYKGENLKVSPGAWKDAVLGIRVTIKDGRNDVKGYFTEEEFAKALAKAGNQVNEELAEEAIF